MKSIRFFEYAHVVCFIVTIFSIWILGMTKINFFFKYNFTEYFKHVVLTKSFLFPLSFLLLSIVFLGLRQYMFKVKNN
jgi:hypothetical protein